MKHCFKTKLLCAALSAAMLLTSPIGHIKAAADDAKTGKYVKEVFIAYGKTEEEAEKWLKDHGWEPVKGDFNDEKISGLDSAVVAVMGIKRTNDSDAAIIDMAVMNMNGSYSFDDYNELLQDKKTEIDEFIDNFMPTIQEFRDNYNGKGSKAGKARSDMAFEFLNKFYDGEPDSRYAVNDTGMPLGELLMKQTRREIGEENYDGLSKNDKLQHGDFQQIMLESNSMAISTMEQALTLGADIDETTWLVLRS